MALADEDDGRDDRGPRACPRRLHVSPSTSPLSHSPPSGLPFLSAGRPLTRLPRLSASRLWNYNPDNDDHTGDDWNGENFSWFSQKRALPPTWLDHAQHSPTLDNGGRILRAVVRPYPAKTAGVPLRFDYEINTRLGGIATADGGAKKPARIMLLAGSDLIATMSEPGVWSEPDLDHILGRYGVLIIERAGADMDQAIDSLSRWRHNIHLIHQLVQNDVSSTKVRLFLRRGLSVRYLLPAPVVDYIEQHGLYMDDGPNASSAVGAVLAEREKGKEKEASTSSAAC